ncbi:MAG: prepilin-type N-terminal cleavage/methylation domain-containing protein [Sedimenticolaceae bacterium]|jgi:MSHA pilin protein MshC
MGPVSLKSETRPQGRVFAAVGIQAGYTVVELVVVLVVLGIIAANAMPRFFQASSFEEMGYADELLGAIRYAHKLALSSRCDTRVTVDPTGYAVYQRANGCRSGAFSRSVVRPGAGNWQGSAPGGVVVGTLDLYFDAQGRPHDVASGSLHGSPQTVSVGGRVVTVEHTTGYVRAG